MKLDDRTDWVALSSPRLDRPLVPAVERLAKHVRAAADQLALAASIPFEQLYAPTRAGLGFTVSASQRALRSAWCLVGEWLVARAVGAHDGAATIAETHAWFWEGHPGGRAGNVHALGTPEAPLASSSEVRALLPYLLDPTSVATRRDVLRTQVTHGQRLARKTSGVYYTPGDVAANMVARSLGDASDEQGPWIDPAHGSGVFLRAILSFHSDPRSVRDHLYGIDIDPFAAEATAFVLAAEDLIIHDSVGAPWERWHHFRRNLATGNSLFVDALGRLTKGEESFAGGLLGVSSPWRVTDVFPEVSQGKFAGVVANPPYVPLPANPNNALLGCLHPVTGATASADISPVFVELGLNLLRPDGALAVVTPLSTVTSTRAPFPQLRGLLAAEPGRVDYSCFDRMPDALFGDDIKTRNAVIHVARRGPNEMTSTPLHRWTSRRRSDALGSAPVASVRDLPGVPATIPKIGTEWERNLYRACLSNGSTLSRWIVARRSRALDVAPSVDRGEWSSTIAVSPSAYNYLGVTLDPSQAVRDGHDSSNAVAMLAFASPRRASAAYALLSSRLAFWLWHVTGDGFHVTARLPSLVPAPVDERSIDALADCGDELWRRASAQPVVSRNRGKTTVTYPSWPHADCLAAIDAEVDALLGEPMSALLQQWHERLIVVDEDSNRVEKMMRNLK